MKFIDHVEEGLNLVTSPYRDFDELLGLIETYLRGCQRLEDTLKDLYENRSLLTAEGVQLDVLGALLGISRGSMNDFLYRRQLISKVLSKLSGGTPDELLRLAQSFQLQGFNQPVPDTPTIGQGSEPASYVIDVPSILAGSLTSLQISLQEATAAGVSLEQATGSTVPLNYCCDSLVCVTEEVNTIIIPISIVPLSEVETAADGNPVLPNNEGHIYIVDNYENVTTMSNVLGFITPTPNTATVTKVVTNDYEGYYEFTIPLGVSSASFTYDAQGGSTGTVNIECLFNDFEFRNEFDINVVDPDVYLSDNLIV